MTTSSTPFVPDREIQLLREEIEKRTGKTPEQLYDEREKRVRDVINLKEPDRVPLMIHADPAGRCGIPRSAAYYDPVAWKLANRQIIMEFEPDMAHAGFAESGLTMEALEVKNRLWPGGPLPPDYEYQFIEGEYMKEDEYDMFLSDPTDFILRRYLPRVYGALAPLAKLPPLGLMFGGFERLTTLLNSPEFQRMAAAISRAGEEMEKFRKLMGDAQEELAMLGFPAFSNSGAVGIGGAPFDTVSSSLRGMKGSMLDMYRQPDKLIRACELILEKRIALGSVPADPAKRGNPKKIGLPLWRGDKAFMSDAQFKKFYWPGLKKAMQTLINLGYVPMPFFEAEFGRRLECLLELPKGKVVATVDHTDAVLAKEILGGHCCISTGGPSSLRLASVGEVESHYKHLLDVCGKGGGLILNLIVPASAAKEEALKLINSIKEYGRY